MENKKENMKKLVDSSRIQPLINKSIEYQTKGYGTCFVFIHGHTSTISIDIHPFGWIPNENPEYEFNLYIGIEEFDEERMNNIVSKINCLMDESETAEDFEKRQQEIQLKKEMDQYEKLKAKFG